MGFGGIPSRPVIRVNYNSHSIGGFKETSKIGNIVGVQEIVVLVVEFLHRADMTQVRPHCGCGSKDVNRGVWGPTSSSTRTVRSTLLRGTSSSHNETRGRW